MFKTGEHLVKLFGEIKSDNYKDPERYRWVKLTVKTYQDKDNPADEDNTLAKERVSKLVRQPEKDSLLSYKASREHADSRVRFNPKEYSVDVDLSERSRLSEHVRTTLVNLPKERQKQMLLFWLLDNKGMYMQRLTFKKKCHD